jgi:CDP-paratose 2-epimerase
VSVAVITGSAGLVGSEASRYFAGIGMDVVGIDNDMRQQFFGPEASTRWNRDRLLATLPTYTHADADACDGCTHGGFHQRRPNRTGQPVSGTGLRMVGP